MISRRRLGALALSGSLVSSLGSVARAQASSVRIGYQKYGTLVLMKEKGFLERILTPKGISVHWAQFPAGPPMLQAMASGAVDIGQTGDLPPIFAQATMPDSFVYFGHETRNGSSEAIIVPENSPIRSVRELKGKRVAVTHGSDAHWLLLGALLRNGLTWQDITVSYLLPAAGRPAFEAGTVDAWAIWNPYLTGAGQNVRVLATGEDVGGGTEFYLARREFVTENRDLLRLVISAIEQCDQWASGNKAEVAAILARSTGLDITVVTASVARIDYAFHNNSPSMVQSQKRIAQAVVDAGLLPSVPDIAQAAPTI